ncbi:MAG: UrcA family protein [Pseudomonadota bacterium]
MFAPRFTTAALLLAASVMLAPSAQAQTQRITVDSRNLDLASEAGRAVMAQRVTHAVNRICGSPHDRLTSEQHNFAACSQAARADAAPQIEALVAAAENARKMAGGSAMPVR